MNKMQQFKNNIQIGSDTLTLIFNATNADIEPLLTQLKSENYIDITESKNGNKYIGLTENGKNAIA